MINENLCAFISYIVKYYLLYVTYSKEQNLVIKHQLYMYSALKSSMKYACFLHELRWNSNVCYSISINKFDLRNS